MTLEEQINQLVNLGWKDPLEIAKKIVKDRDKRWLASELMALAEDIIAERSRHALGNVRRGAEIALRPGESRSQQEIKISSFWVPGFGHKPGGDLTPDDLRLRASFYDRLSFAAVRRASWCRDVAAMMDSQGAKRLRDFKGELPPLPGEDDLPELGEAA